MSEPSAAERRLTSGTTASCQRSASRPASRAGAAASARRARGPGLRPAGGRGDRGRPGGRGAPGRRRHAAAATARIPGAAASSRERRWSNASAVRSPAGRHVLHERQLERQARVGALADVVEHGAQQVDQPVDGRRLEPLGLAREPGPLVVGHGRLGGQPPELLLEEDQPQVGEEVGDERPQVGPGVGLRVDCDEAARCVGGGDPVDRGRTGSRRRSCRGARGRRRPRSGRCTRSRAGRAPRRRRGSCPTPPGRRATPPPRRSRSTRPRRCGEAASRSRAARAGRTRKRWHRLRIVGSMAPISVVQSTKTTWSGGSSSVFRTAFDASFVSMCASSTMYTLRRPCTGRSATRSRISRMSSMPRWLAASSSMTSTDVASWIDRHDSHSLHGVGRRPVLAVERLGQDLGHRRLAGSARAGEQVGVRDPVELDRVSQRADDVLLTDDLVEVLGAMGAVEGGHLVQLNRRPCGGRDGAPGDRLQPVPRLVGVHRRGGALATVHPPSKRRTRAVPAALAPARLAHGTRVTLLSAASFRT